MTAVRSLPCTAYCAAFSPAAPPPMTTTSQLWAASDGRVEFMWLLVFGMVVEVQQVAAATCYASVTETGRRVTAGHRRGASSVKMEMINIARQRLHGHLW